MAFEKFYPVPLTIITDYSYRSIWWASLVFVIAFTVSFFYLKFRRTTLVLWEAPGSKASPLFLALAVTKAVCRNQIVHHNVSKYIFLHIQREIEYFKEKLLVNNNKIMTQF